MTSTADALVRDLRANVRSLRDALDREQPLADRLAAALLGLIDAEPVDHHRHLLGNPDMCCRLVALQQHGPQQARATEAITAWQQARTGSPT